MTELYFRTGEVRRFPDADTPTDQIMISQSSAKDNEAIYFIHSLKTKKLRW